MWRDTLRWEKIHLLLMSIIHVIRDIENRLSKQWAQLSILPAQLSSSNYGDNSSTLTHDAAFTFSSSKGNRGHPSGLHNGHCTSMWQHSHHKNVLLGHLSAPQFTSVGKMFRRPCYAMRSSMICLFSWKYHISLPKLEKWMRKPDRVRCMKNKMEGSW